MVEAFAMMAGTALEYGVRILACLKVIQMKKLEYFPLVNLVESFSFFLFFGFF